MGFLEYFVEGKNKTLSYKDVIIMQKAGMLNVKDFAINKAASMIAKVVAKSEFLVITKTKGGKFRPVKNEEYYLLNIRPNLNQDGTSFWFQAAHRALTDPEGCLIVNIKDTGLFIADTFKIGSSVMNVKTVTEVKVGEFSFTRSFTLDDCLLLKLGDGNVTKYLDTYFKEIGEMLAYAAKDFKIKNSKKWRFAAPTQLDKIVDSETGQSLSSQKYANLLDERINDDSRTVVSIPDSIRFEGLSGGEVKTSQDFRDILELALESAAMAYDIPIDVFTGKKTDKSTSIKDFITFAIDPVFEMIEDEINAKLVSKKEYLEGTKVKIDKSRIQHVDFFDTADAELKLILSGYSHDDLLIAKGLEPLDEPWSKQRSITGSNGKGGTGV